MDALGVLLIVVLFVVAFLAITAMVISMAPYLAVLAIVGIVVWLASHAPDPEEKDRPRKWRDRQ